ncbi:MAG: hypothetical protein MHM6MM_000083 [Cercozoa sp. M6MM]
MFVPHSHEREELNNPDSPRSEHLGLQQENVAPVIGSDEGDVESEQLEQAPAASQEREVTLWEKARAEFIGTYIFVLIIVGVGYASLLSGGISPLDGAIVIGLTLALVIYLIGPISGGHVNPAVTFAFFVMRPEFRKRQFLFYITAQVLGAFFAAWTVHSLWFRVLDDFEDNNGYERSKDGGENSVGVLLPQTPANLALLSKNIPVIEGFFVELLGTAIFLLVIVSVTNSRNPVAGASLAPLWIGLTITVQALCFGALSGFSINPARDFGARLVALIVGFEEHAFPGRRDDMWVYWVGPLVGGVIGVAIYDYFLASAIDKLPAPPGEEEVEGGTKRERRKTLFAIYGNAESQQKSHRERLMGMMGGARDAVTGRVHNMMGRFGLGRGGGNQPATSEAAERV